MYGLCFNYVHLRKHDLLLSSVLSFTFCFQYFAYIFLEHFNIQELTPAYIAPVLEDIQTKLFESTPRISTRRG